MASMAFVPGTMTIKINNEDYVDGGFRDTTPVKALIEHSEKLDKIYVINVNEEKRKWNENIIKNENTSFIVRLLFVSNDILWDEANRSDIEIGMLRFWNIDDYHVIYPEFRNISTTDFDTKLIKEAYDHGVDVGKKIKD
jgi:predicted patatin/cPLA2 family phospholipase